MKIIVGLGNPTKKYENTRHNMGFDFIDRISSKYKIPMKRSRFTALVGKGEIKGEQVMLVKPQTFMNLSGEAVGRIVKFYKADWKKDLVVVYDDTDLDIGKIRLKAKGSAGGHNGMKSIISHVGGEDFKRIRIGIGKRGENSDMIDFVLGKFAPADRKEIDIAIDNAVLAMEEIIVSGIETAMNRYN